GHDRRGVAPGAAGADRIRREGRTGELERVTQEEQPVGERLHGAVAIDIERSDRREALREHAGVAAVLGLALPRDHEFAVSIAAHGGVDLAAPGRAVDLELDAEPVAAGVEAP